MRRRFTPALAFNLLTPLYDRVNDFLGFGKPFMRRVVELANVTGDERVLDVGCGTGSLLLEMISQNPCLDFVGMDPDQKTLQIAKSKFKWAEVGGRLVQGAAQELLFLTGSLDLVTSTLIFHHLPTRVKLLAIKEIHRVLRDGGRFVLADFGKPKSVTTEVLIRLGSIFDGTENMKANLEGNLPVYLSESGFQVSEVGERYKGIQFLLAIK